MILEATLSYSAQRCWFAANGPPRPGRRMPVSTRLSESSSLGRGLALAHSELWTALAECLGEAAGESGGVDALATGATTPARAIKFRLDWEGMS